MFNNLKGEKEVEVKSVVMFRPGYVMVLEGRC
jgi:hypothetical protein